MNLQLGSALGTATLSDGDVEGTFTMYAVRGLPRSQCALVARTANGWIFIRANDGPLEWFGTYGTASEALAALANAILQSYLDEVITPHYREVLSFEAITGEPPLQEARGTPTSFRRSRRTGSPS
jgi:hypothetical protein